VEQQGFSLIWTDDRGGGISRPPWNWQPKFYILEYMKQILIEIDDELIEKLEKVAPSRSRRRSEFVRNAIRQAIWDLQERETAEAYRQQPDSNHDAYLDSSVWEPPPKRRVRRQRK
jgi:predicted DNA-binding protein